MSATSPSPSNYVIGKGTIEFQAAGTGAWRDLGNAPLFKLERSIEKTEHFSSRSGIKSKDASIVTQESGTVSITLDEITPENLQLALAGGAISGTGTTGKSFNIGEAVQITGLIRMTGTNTQGNRFAGGNFAVIFNPAPVDFISDDILALELTGEWIRNPADTTSPLGKITELA